MKLSQNCRINYVGRDLWGYLVQSPLERGIKTEFKSGCLGLCPLMSANPPEMEVLQPLHAHVPMLDCCRSEKYFTSIKSEPSLCTTGKILALCLLSNLLWGMSRLLKYWTLLQAKQAQFPESFLTGPVLQPTDCCLGLLLSSERSLKRKTLRAASVFPVEIFHRF